MKKKLVTAFMIFVMVLSILSPTATVRASEMIDEAIPLDTFEIMPCEFKAGETKYFLIEITKAGTLNIETQGARGGGWDKSYLYDLEGAQIANKDVYNNVNFNVHLDKGSYIFRFDRATYSDETAGVTTSTLKNITTFTPDQTTTMKLKITLSKGDDLQLGTIVEPSSEKVTWKTSKKSVAKVSSSGLVTAVKKGKCTIYACLESGKILEVAVIVK